MDSWFREVKAQSEPDALIFLVGNQCDRESEREVSREKAEKFKKERGIDYFIETSAKTNENVEKLFMMAGKMLFKKYQKRIKQNKENLRNKRNSRGQKLSQANNNAAQKK
jgi:GTPase SAR1 family protein